MSGQPEIKVTHGSALTARHVGVQLPEAKLERRSGGPICDATTPFVHLVEQRARYGAHVVDGPHLLLAGVRINGAIDICARLPVVISQVLLVAGAGHWGIHTRPGSGRVLIHHATLIGSDKSHAGAGVFVRSDNVKLERCHILNFTDGVLASAAGLLVNECLIADITHVPGDHNDGVQLQGAPRDVVIRRCRIANRNRQTSAIKIQGKRILVEDCHLAGGGWTIYGGARHGASEVTITRNVLARDHFHRVGFFGAVTDWSRDPARANRWIANRRDDNRLLKP